MPRTFDELWEAERDRVRAACRRILADNHLAEDAAQETYIRARRGYVSFQNGCPFGAWVARIATNLSLNIRERRAREILAAELPDTIAPAGEPTADSSQLRDLSAAIRAAAAENLLAHKEAEMLLATLEDPPPSREEMARRLGISGGDCAVYLLRSKHQLRLYLMMRRPDLIGGREQLRQAFDEIRRTTRGDRLTPEEAAAFEKFVLRAGARPPRNEMKLLRTACLKVSKRVDVL